MDEPDRLDSWKQIAAYFGKSERTVRRWQETEGLPVHKHLHQQRGSVWAYKSELDAWLEKRRVAPEPLADVATQSGNARFGRRAAALLSVAAIGLVALVAASMIRSRGTPTVMREPIR